ncbi:hypothetical protein LR48_Vigan102s004500 [Vigna angularis]|uniref:Uncharacterized protein n=1 Tax=Phaseolus angularis TaxID=3914 RepID=A0A0L9T479_PHAAN|nr:hypothetical protein LR48_Vigan102s004500 [Vigna angularis]
MKGKSPIANTDCQFRSTPSSQQRGKTLSKLNGKARSLGSTPKSNTERTSGKSLSVNVEGREVNPSRFMMKDERTRGKSLSVNVEGRVVNPSRLLVKDERSSGKTLSVHVEGRAVNPYRLMLKDERTSDKSLSVNVEGRRIKRSQFGKRSLPQTHKSYS